MSDTLVTESAGSPHSPAASRKEQRRRPRAKIAAPIRVRTHNNVTANSFVEVCTTNDASRDGLYFVSVRKSYFKGLLLALTFPYAGTPSPTSREQTAEIVRVFPLADEKWGVAVRFCKGAGQEAIRRAGHAPIEPLPSERPEVQRPLCLAVDSDPRTRMMLENVLCKDGYEVAAYATATEALEFLRDRIPAMLIAEIENDDMSGYDLCLVLKSDPRLQFVPVALTTRTAQPSDYSTAHALGAVICMAKPYKAERLLLVAHLLAPPDETARPFPVRGSSSN